MSSSLANVVREAIKATSVLVYSKTTCPFCYQTKSVNYTAIDLDREDNGRELQQVLFELTQQRTVPNIFIAGKHIGGFDDLVQGLQTGNVYNWMTENNISYVAPKL